MRSISEKRLAKLGGKMPFSSIVPKPDAKPKRSKRLASEIAPSRKPVRKSNPKRKAKEFARCYHSEERVEWIKQRRCVASGVHGDIENAHTEGDGISRKAHYSKIVPLRRELHRELHRIGRDAFERKYGFRLASAASATETDWQAECARRGYTTH